MTRVTAGPAGLDMTTPPTVVTAISQTVTSSSIELVLPGGQTEILSGSFAIANGSVTGGTITSYQIYFGQQRAENLSVTIDKTTLLLSTYNSFLTANDPTGLRHYVFGGHDEYVGTTGTDIFVGVGGNDTFIGGSGTETFEPAGGSNTITGGSGVDRIIFQGPSSAYAITNQGGGSITVTDSVASRNGTDHITNVQFLSFTDKQIFALTPDEARIALLYQGALGRTPDPTGLVGWEKSFFAESAEARNAGNFTALAGTAVNGLPNLAYGFTQSVEFQTKYGALSDAQFVTQLYSNVLDRTPDASGLNGWVSALSQGHSREWVLVGFVESPEAYHNAEVGYVGHTGVTHPAWMLAI